MWVHPRKVKMDSTIYVLRMEPTLYTNLSKKNKQKTKIVHKTNHFIYYRIEVSKGILEVIQENLINTMYNLTNTKTSVV